MQPELPIPWTVISKPLTACKFGLVTSGGLYQRVVMPPFDVERERRNPSWGDPTFRAIPSDVLDNEIGVSHLHINPRPILEDFNVVLPIRRFQEMAASGEIGSLAYNAYSFMGYQGYPPDASAWRDIYAPRVAERLKAEGVDCVLLTPA
jgi:D-proline reductase (dithiol) PrdB